MYEEFDYAITFAKSPTAMDVGANEGEITALLIDKGFTVIALEPNPAMTPRLEKLGAAVFPLAASDVDGWKELSLCVEHPGLSSFEEEWQTIAFPGEFKAGVKKILVRLCKLTDLLGDTSIGLLKIDTEGHDYKVLRGLFDGPNRPDVIIFEGNQRFPDVAEKTLLLLSQHGYGRFRMYLRCGGELLATTDFEGTKLPDTWFAFPEKYCFANFVAVYGGVQ
jgi:FkbM family methyltransferase